MLEVVLTREDANSESALLVEWLLDDRTLVSKGQAVCVVETSKATIEIEAPGEGTLCQIAREGQEVELGRRIAVIVQSAQELSELEQAAPADTAPTAVSEAKATRKAVELAAQHGIDLTTIVKTGFITADDVAALLTHGANRPAVASDRRSGLLGGVDIEGVSLPSSFTTDEESGRLEPDFFERLRVDPGPVRALTADERLALYRRHGAHIEADVRLGERSLIVAPRIVLEAGVEIGDDSTISVDEELSVGALTKFGARLRLGCRRVFIGSGGQFGEDVHIGGGGRQDPQALLVIGDLAYVGAEAFINPCRPVIIGREAFVTMRSMIVTHNIGHSLLEGFENLFAPVVLEDRVQVGLGAVVYAGVRVGRESIVASNSYVVTNVPAGKIASGVPARVSGSARRTLSQPRRDELAAGMVDELQELLVLRGHAVEPVDGEAGRGFSLIVGGEVSYVLFAPRLAGASLRLASGGGETVVLTLSLDGPAPDGCSVLELLGRRVHGSGGVVLDTAREFCRKRGIRFEPGPWRYQRGLI